MTTESRPDFAQRYNILLGIIICGILAAIYSLVLQIGVVALGDIFLVVCCCVGLFVTFENRKESQSHLKTGIIVGLAGSILSLVLIALGFSLVYMIDFISMLIIVFLNNGIIFIFVGLIVGYLFGNYYRKRESSEINYPRN